MKKLLWISLLVMGIVMAGCSSDNDDPTPPGEIVEMIVVCEGQFGVGTSALSAIYADGTSKTDIFRDVNNMPLGDVAQSLTYLDGKYFVVINNSQQIKVVEPGTFKLLGTIDYKQTASPRYMVKLNDNEALVSDLYQQLTVVNYKDYTVSTHYDLSGLLSANDSQYVEVIIRVGNKIFCTIEGYGENELNEIWVYDVNDFQPLNPRRIKIDGLYASDKLVVDKNGNLWTMGVDENKNPMLYCIDTATETINTNLSYSIPIEDPASAKANGIIGFSWKTYISVDAAKSKLYFVAQSDTNIASVFTFDVSTRTVARYCNLLEDINSVYGMGISPAGEVYICDCMNYSPQGGFLRHYTATGRVESTLVGIFPSSVHFTEYETN